MTDWKWFYLPMASRSLSALGLAVILVGSLLFASQTARSQTHFSTSSFLHCTRETSILRAFELMRTGPGVSSLQRIVDKPMRVVFKDMGMIHKGLKNYDALSWISAHGEQVIFVNQKHRNAPPEALAAVIAHEAMHEDDLNSIAEEVQGWETEALVWIALKASNPNLASIPEGAFPLVDRENSKCTCRSRPRRPRSCMLRRASGRPTRAVSARASSQQLQNSLLERAEDALGRGRLHPHVDRL